MNNCSNKKTFTIINADRLCVITIWHNGLTTTVAQQWDLTEERGNKKYWCKKKMIKHLISTIHKLQRDDTNDSFWPYQDGIDKCH